MIEKNCSRKTVESESVAVPLSRRRARRKSFIDPRRNRVNKFTDQLSRNGRVSRPSNYSSFPLVSSPLLVSPLPSRPRAKLSEVRADRIWQMGPNAFEFNPCRPCRPIASALSLPRLHSIRGRTNLSCETIEKVVLPDERAALDSCLSTMLLINHAVSRSRIEDTNEHRTR